MEGGRSRTGKLRPPKYGLLRYLVDAIESGVADDMLLVPVAITYDQLHEIGVMAAEEAGAQKAKEGLRWLADYARMQQKWIGTAYVRFGEPLSLQRGAGSAPTASAAAVSWTVEKIAFEVFSAHQPGDAGDGAGAGHAGAARRRRPRTDARRSPSAGRAAARLRAAARPADRDARSAEDRGRALAEVLRHSRSPASCSRYAQGTEPVYGINPGQHSVAAFYRNSAIHWFVNRAITELAWFMDSARRPSDPLPQAWQRGFALRDLLKFDFFFSDTRHLPRGDQGRDATARSPVPLACGRPAHTPARPCCRRRS